MDRAIASAAQLWHRFTLTRYFAASVAALGFDIGIFTIAVAMGVLPALASAMGYSAGIFIHWMISANIVFPGKTRQGAARHLQRALFAGSALVGLGITVGVVTLGTAAGIPPLPSKILAVGASFVIVYAIRKWGVFK